MVKKVYITEVLILFFSAVAGMCIYEGGWIGYLSGFIIINLTSYFFVSKLKEQTMKEYLNLVKESKRK